MKNSSRSKIKDQRYELAFLAEIDFINRNMANFFEIEGLGFATQVFLMNLLDGIPTEARQRSDILNRGHPAQIDHKAFQRAGVVFFRVGKGKVRLFDSTAFFALKSGNLYEKFDFLMADRRHLERAEKVAESDDIAGFTVGALQIVGMNSAMKDRLGAQKTAFVYCTAETPKV